MTESAPPTTLTESLAAFQMELPSVQKSARNDHFGKSYADLADVARAVIPALARQGLAWITNPTMTEGGFALIYSLRHTVSGESIDGTWPLPNPTEQSAQAVGSAITYARRYALSAVTGVAPDEDDDGNEASKPPAPKSPPADWKQRIANAADMGTLTVIHNEAHTEGWKNAQVLAALNARRAVITARPQTPAEGEDASPSASPASPSAGSSEPTQEEYEAAEAARFDAAMDAGAVSERG